MADDSKDIEGEESGGGRKKLIVIIAAAVLLLLAAGAAALFLMGGEEESVGEGETAQEEVVEEPEEGDPIYVAMQPKFVVSLPPGGPAGMLQISVTAYTRQQPVADFIRANDPLLRHHLNNLFESRSAAELLTLEGKEALQQEVQDVLTQQLEEMDQPGSIKGVYFTEFVLQ